VACWAVGCRIVLYIGLGWVVRSVFVGKKKKKERRSCRDGAMDSSTSMGS